MSVRADYYDSRLPTEEKKSVCTTVFALSDVVSGALYNTACTLMLSRKSSYHVPSAGRSLACRMNSRKFTSSSVMRSPCHCVALCTATDTSHAIGKSSAAFCPSRS